MGNRILFQFEEKEYSAIIHLSLQDEGCYIFSFFKDPALIAAFGTDIDIVTDCVNLLPDKIINEDLLALKTAILEAAKQLPEFHQQKPRKLIIPIEQLN